MYVLLVTFSGRKWSTKTLKASGSTFESSKFLCVPAVLSPASSPCSQFSLEPLYVILPFLGFHRENTSGGGGGGGGGQKQSLYFLEYKAYFEPTIHVTYLF